MYLVIEFDWAFSHDLERIWILLIEVSLYFSFQLNSNQFYKHLVSAYYVQSTEIEALNNSVYDALWCVTYFSCSLSYWCGKESLYNYYLNCLDDAIFLI